MRIISNGRFLGIVLTLFAVTTAACSGIERSYCDKQRQCIGGNELDLNACTQQWIYEGKVAGDYGCADAFNKYLTCLDMTSTCDTTLGVKNFKNSCDAEDSALEACKTAASVKGNGHYLTSQPTNGTATSDSK